MMVLINGVLSSVTGGLFISGVSTPPIDLSKDKLDLSNACAWISVEGDLGRSGGSVAVFWLGCYAKGGVTFAMQNTGQYFVKSGTSVSGQFANGSYLKKFLPGMPFIRLGAVASKSGSTQHGSSTTNTCSVKWAVAIP